MVRGMLKVGVVGPVFPDAFAWHIGDALERLGHAVTMLSQPRLGRGLRGYRAMAVACRFLPSLEARAQDRIVRAARAAGCEIVISVDARLTPGAVTRLRRDGARVAFWFPDAVVNIGRQQMLLAPYDAVFFKDPLLVERLRATLDLPVYYLPEACNQRWHRPTVPAGTEPFLVIAGNMYPSRVRLLNRLVGKGIPLRLYGPGFPRWLGAAPARRAHTGRMIFCAEKARIFRSAAAVLNPMHPAENGANCRLFEAAGCGAAVLTEYRPAIAELFEMGEEVLAFHDFDDLVDQASRLLGERGLTARIGDAATRRAHRDHSYDLRLASILDRLS
jgi:spore maturation protein CgeB